MNRWVRYLIIGAIYLLVACFCFVGTIALAAVAENLTVWLHMLIK